jgi:hypothetical protein
MLALLSSVIAAPSGAIAGKLFDSYGNYIPALELIGLISIAGMVAVAFAKIPRISNKPEGTPGVAAMRAE